MPTIEQLGSASEEQLDALAALLGTMRMSYSVSGIYNLALRREDDTTLRGRLIALKMEWDESDAV